MTRRQGQGGLGAFQAMEDQLMKAAVANSKEWFNKAKLIEGQVDVYSIVCYTILSIVRDLM